MAVKQTKTTPVKKVVKPKTVLEPKENLTETIKPINDDALTDKNDKNLTDILGEIRDTLNKTPQPSEIGIKGGEEVLEKLSEIETELLALKENLKTQKNSAPPQIVNSWNGTTFI